MSVCPMFWKFWKISYFHKIELFFVTFELFQKNIFFRQILRFSNKNIFCQKKIFYCQIRCFFVKFEDFQKKIFFAKKKDVLLSNSMFFRQILRFSKKNMFGQVFSSNLKIFFKKIFFAKKRCFIAKFDVFSSNFKIFKIFFFAKFNVFCQIWRFSKTNIFGCP